MRAVDAVAAWEAQGTRLGLLGYRIFVIDRRAARDEADPLLVLHGFPSCSFDYRHVIDALAARRRVVLLDFLGYGLSDKPADHRYSLFEQADIVEAAAKELGLASVALLTHDMGDSVGGELLARSLDGTLGLEVTERVITNGSIYMDLVQLSAGQQLLLALPDEALPAEQAPTGEMLKPGLAFTFGPDTQPDDEELEAQWLLVAREGGNRILPRLIRYVEERRTLEPRWTGAIEGHPSPLTIVWGDLDPIAVFAMAERLAERCAGARLEPMRGVGHYPMIEAPERFAQIVTSALS